jgi:hypothetical protein
MTQATETKRGRGRPASFPDVETNMAGYNLPQETLDLVKAAVEKRNKNRGNKPRINQNQLVDRALRAFLRRG